MPEHNETADLYITNLDGLLGAPHEGAVTRIQRTTGHSCGSRCDSPYYILIQGHTMLPLPARPQLFLNGQQIQPYEGQCVRLWDDCRRQAS